MTTPGYVVDLVLDDSVLPELQRMQHAWLAQQSAADTHPDVVLLWRVTPETHTLLEQVRATARVQGPGGRDVQHTLVVDDLAEMLTPLPARVDLEAGGRQVRVLVAGHTLTVTPRRLAIVPQDLKDRWAPSKPRLTLWVDGGTNPDAGLVGARVLPFPAATPRDLQALVDRAAALDSALTATAPTRMLAAAANVTTHAHRAKDRKVREVGVGVLQTKNGTSKGVQVEVRLLEDTQLLLTGGPEYASGDPQSVVDKLMDQVARVFSTDTLRLFTSLCCLMDRHGQVALDYATLARLRGWDPATLDSGSSSTRPGKDGTLVPRSGSRRKALQDAVDTLVRYRFQLVEKRKDATERQYLTGPLVVELARGHTERNGQRRERGVVLQLNPILFVPEAKAGLLAAFDKRLLMTTDQTLRLGVWLTRRMAQSLATERLDKHEQVEQRVETMLSSAGLTLWPELIRKHGPAGARQQVQAWLEELRDLDGGGPALWFQYVPADAAVDDRVLWRPAIHVLQRQAAVSSKRLRARDNKLASMPAEQHAGILRQDATAKPSGS
jgi:hypothetical protein